MNDSSKAHCNHEYAPEIFRALISSLINTVKAWYLALHAGFRDSQWVCTRVGRIFSLLQDNVENNDWICLRASTLLNLVFLANKHMKP